MSFLNPEPLDPFYVKFRDGFKTIVRKTQRPGLRWGPWSNGGEWLDFDLARWDFIDFGVISQKALLEAKLNFETAPWQYEWDWDRTSSERDLPPIWAAINKVYSNYKTARPTAAWNPYDGSWREMRVRPSSGTTGDGSETPSAAFARRAKQLHDQYVTGVITDEIYKTRLLELTREYF
jgi:hypothetical protein